MDKSQRDYLPLAEPLQIGMDWDLGLFKISWNKIIRLNKWNLFG